MEGSVSVVETADQEQPPCLEIAGMGGVRVIASGFEHRTGRAEHLHGLGEIAGDERDLGFGDDAPGSGCWFIGAEGAGGGADEVLGAGEVA